MRAGRELSSAKMRLEGTKFAVDMRKLWELLSSINSSLIDEIKGK